MWRISLLIVMMTFDLQSFVSGSITDKDYHSLLITIENLQDEIRHLKESTRSTVTSLARQVSQQQLYVEEMTRSSGDSGLKITRLSRTGSKTYYSTSFVDQSIAAIHSHSNYINLVGMGEIIAVLNGVEFRTRHNDFKLRMPSPNSTEYGATEDIPYPPVPPEVLNKKLTEEQIAEMREWFKAWKSSDHSVRDYRPYFKANLCYLEGMWTNTEDDAMDEPFMSDRHSINANSFFDLQKKIRFTSATGTKDSSENYAYLPSTIAAVDSYGNVKYSQWNYNILCHPLRREVPLTRLRLEEDLGARVANSKRFEDLLYDRSARFSLYEGNPYSDTFSTRDQFVTERLGSFLDDLMSEIPGKDNYPANITTDNELSYPVNVKPGAEKPLNLGYYNHAYKLANNKIIRRGFSDNNLYVAYNSRPKITPISAGGSVSRVSYAIPLEIIYTTPLNTWNPYGLAYRTDTSMPINAKKVDGKLRNGGMSADSAYYGTSPEHYFMTPSHFFDNATIEPGKEADADTVSNADRGVLNQEGAVKRVMPSGISIITDNIPGVGPVRIRYPIMPIHEHGNTIYKDLSALTDMTLKKHKYLNLYPDLRSYDNGTFDEVYTFETNAWTVLDSAEAHLHTITLTMSEVTAAIRGQDIRVTTSIAAGHKHELTLYYQHQYKLLSIRRCDDRTYGECHDGHKGRIICTDCRGGFPVV